MTDPVTPNPHSPYADANPNARHLLPSLFGLPPTPGGLAPAGCGRGRPHGRASLRDVRDRARPRRHLPHLHDRPERSNPMNPIGADQAMAIRTAASELSELENLANTSCLREIFYDLAEALSDLHEPLKTLLTTADEMNGKTSDRDSGALFHLQNLAALLSHQANNL